MNYVYRFLDKNGIIIYVGKTGSIKPRMNQHFGTTGHLPSECYLSVETIEYIKIKSKIDMDIKELYYINKWKPFYNNQNKYDEELSISIDENEDWISFRSKSEEEKEELKKRIQELEEIRVSSREIIKEKSIEIVTLNKKMDELRTEIDMSKIDERIFDGVNTEFYKIKDILDIHKNNNESIFYSEITSNNVTLFKIVVYSKESKTYIKDLISGFKGEYNKFKDLGQAFHMSYIAESVAKFKLVNANEPIGKGI